jgi:hypothetical protein
MTGQAALPPIPPFVARRDSILQGDFGVLSLAEILELLRTQRKTGLLTIRSGTRSVTLHVHLGMVYEASISTSSKESTSPMRPEDLESEVWVAIELAASWPAATFAFRREEPGPEPRIKVDPETSLARLAEEEANIWREGITIDLSA